MDYASIHLDRSQPTQLHFQLATALAQAFSGTESLGGELLPSIREMSRLLCLNRATVQKAYMNLEDEGFILRDSPYRYRIIQHPERKQISPFPNIGIILPTTFRQLMQRHNSMTTQIVTGIIDAATQMHLSVMMLPLPDFNAAEDEIQAFNESISQKLLGVIHLGGRKRSYDRPLRAVMKTLHLPQVMVAAYPILSHVGAVVFDLTQGTNALAESLRKLHHRDIGLVTYSSRLRDKSTYDCLLTYDAFKRSELVSTIFQAHELNCHPDFHCLGCTSKEAVYKALRRKQQEGYLPTCYWCNNDLLAVWTMQSLQELGLRVPQDISVVGFDGSDLAIQEQLTSISLPFFSLGSRAVQLLMDYFEQGMNDENRIVQLPSSLMAGKTLGKAPG